MFGLISLFISNIASIERMRKQHILWYSGGLLFSVCWSSSSSALKFALAVAQPMVIALVRFITAGLLMLLIAHIVKREKLPSGSDWRKLVLCGILNITIYSGLYTLAMRDITAGVGALGIATNPVLISLISVLVLGRKTSPAILISIMICLTGVFCAAWPLLGSAGVTSYGLLLLFLSMVSYSVGSLFITSVKWNGLGITAVNGWQTLIGGVLFTPLTLYFYDPSLNHPGIQFLLSVSWLALVVSCVATLLWMWLLQQDPVKAGLWMFLCPLFGFITGALLLSESVSVWTVAGVVLVIGGLLISRR